jgi:hypothetical protein
MARTGCTNHCMGCGRHFTGLSLFDTHRKDGACRDPETVKTKTGEPVFQSVDDGFCNKLPGCYIDGRHVKDAEPVVVWQGHVSEADRARLREAFNR